MGASRRAVVASVIVTAPAAPAALATEQFLEALVSRRSRGRDGEDRCDLREGDGDRVLAWRAAGGGGGEATVQVARALAARVVEAKVTAVGVVAAE